jgi:hypothetical protein
MAERNLALAASTNVSSATYDDETLECTVTFQSGGSYVVADVSTSEAQQFERAGSAGKFYHEYFRHGKVVTKL